MNTAQSVDYEPPRIAAPSIPNPIYTWLANGRAFFRYVQDSMQLAAHSVDVEFYMYKPGALADALRDLLIAAAARGCRVRVLLDAYGTDELPTGYWRHLTDAGGEVRYFNPKRLLRLSFRDHRKLVVVDGSQAILGGCNVGDEYAGDGVNSGWRDLGIAVAGGEIVHALQQSFAQMWSNATFGLAAIAHFRQWTRSAHLQTTDCELLLSGAGMNGARMRARLHHDISQGHEIDILAAYFLPSRRLRKLLSRRAAIGSVSVIVPASGDVTLAHWARQYITRSMHASGVRFYEYQPAMLHAKLILIDDIVYVGSANLDVRSHRINYELLLRIQNHSVAAQARATVDSIRRNSVELTNNTRVSLTTRWRERLAYLMLSRLDPYIAQRKLRNLQ